MALKSSFRENGSIVITSDDRLTIENATEFSSLVLEALDTARVVAVEFPADVVMDITAIQILYSACKTASNSGKTFSYIGEQPQGLAAMIMTCGAERGVERHEVCKHSNESTCIWFGGAK